MSSGNQPPAGGVESGQRGGGGARPPSAAPPGGGGQGGGGAGPPPAPGAAPGRGEAGGADGLVDEDEVAEGELVDHVTTEIIDGTAPEVDPVAIALSERDEYLDALGDGRSCRW